MMSRKSSSSSGSIKFITPTEIERLLKNKQNAKDLFESLLEESSNTFEVDEDTYLNKTIDEMNLSPRSHQGCKCSKIDCLKLYCECFSKGRLCNRHCICSGCKNCAENQYGIYKAKQLANLRHPQFFKGIPSLPQTRKCTCKKSLCQKKYCECFSAGLKCTEECECIDCHNEGPQISINSRMEIQVHA